MHAKPFEIGLKGTRVALAFTNLNINKHVLIHPTWNIWVTYELGRNFQTLNDLWKH